MYKGNDVLALIYILKFKPLCPMWRNKDRSKKPGKEAVIKVQVRDNENSYYVVIVR